MKKRWIIFAALFCFKTAAQAGQTPAAGLLIYTDYPVTYVEACEFATLDTGKPLYSTVVRADGKQLQINNGGLWIEVDYPPAAPKGNMKALAGAKLAQIDKLLSQYPQFKPRLKVAQARWQHALEVAASQPVSKPATPPPAPVEVVTSDPAPAPGTADPGDEKFNFVTRDGVKFVNATISGTDAKGVTFVTDSGIEHVAFEQMPPDLQQRFHYRTAKAH